MHFRKHEEVNSERNPVMTFLFVCVGLPALAVACWPLALFAVFGLICNMAGPKPFNPGLEDYSDRG